MEPTKRGDRVFKEVGAKPIELTNYVTVTGQGRCNVRTWAVPVAETELKAVKISANGHETYDVIYTWQWKPNALGEAFQANSPVYRKLQQSRTGISQRRGIAARQSLSTRHQAEGAAN